MVKLAIDKPNTAGREAATSTGSMLAKGAQRVNSVQPTSELHWAYIAGFFDGEGTLNWDGHGWRAEITQTKDRGKAICEWICITTGTGKVALNRPANGNHSALWRWYVRGPSIYPFLLAIRPYTRIKSEKIDEALAHFDAQASLLV